MGYLSCKAETSVAVSNPQHQHPPPQSKKDKPIEIQEFQYSDLEAATNGFSDQKLLGKGSHGFVYKGVLRGGRLVAVKKSAAAARANSSSRSKSNEVENEIQILSQLRSPRLVNLVGFTADPAADRLLVVEFMSNGTLYDVLHSGTRPLNWGRRIRLVLQTAMAIDSLHSLNPPVIHRDIKSANVLIDRNFNARLGDFGLALRCNTDDYRLLSTPPAGTIGYLDPDYVTPDNLSTKTDVFSFGILLLEIISGRKAIDIEYSPPSIVDWAIPLIKKGGRLSSIFDSRLDPPKDPAVRKHLAVLAAHCVRSCREKRPSMKEIVESLSGLSKLVPLHSWNGFSKPCMMVDTIGKQVELKHNDLSMKPRVEEDDGKLTRTLRNSSRVYSDLGIRRRRGLKDLIAVGEEEEEAELGSGKASRLRFGSARFVKSDLQLRRNKSIVVN